MATIEKRVFKNKTTYRVKIELKGFPKESASFERLADARRWEKETETKIREGRYFKSNASRDHTLTDAVDRYLRVVLPLKPKSLYARTIQLNFWKQELGEYALAHINAALIAETRDKLIGGRTPRGKRSPSTVNRYMAALSHLFTVAYKEWGWADENPFFKLSKLKEPRGRVRFLSEKEKQSLLHACQESPSPFLYPITLLCLLTGARKMEISGLSWENVDFKMKKIILIDTKNDETRSIPLSSIAMQILKDLEKKAQSTLSNKLIFPSPTKPTQPVDVTKAWKTVIAKLGIENFKFHDLRHSAASYLAMNGATLRELAEILGHKTLSMVNRYAHLTESHTAKVIEAMNKKVFGKVPRKVAS